MICFENAISLLRRFLVFFGFFFLELRHRGLTDLFLGGDGHFVSVSLISAFVRRQAFSHQGLGFILGFENRGGGGDYRITSILLKF